MSLENRLAKQPFSDHASNIKRHQTCQSHTTTKRYILQQEMLLLEGIPKADLHLHGTVVVESRKIAIAEAKKAENPSPKDLVYFVDASVMPLLDTAAAAVVRKKAHKQKGSRKWETEAFLVGQAGAEWADEAELAAISGALTMAFSKVSDQEKMEGLGPIRRVVVYSDCKRALSEAGRWLHEPLCRAHIESNDTMRRIIVSSHLLSQLHIQVSLRWVPGHSRVKGNVKADGVARRMASGKLHKTAGPSIEDDYLRSLALMSSRAKKTDMLDTGHDTEADKVGIARRQLCLAFDPLQQCYVFYARRP